MTSESFTGPSIPDSGFDPYNDTVRRDPYPYYRILRERGPVHRGAHGLWYALTYTSVRQVLSDERFGMRGFRELQAQQRGPGMLRDILGLSIFVADPPDHERLRLLVRDAFSPRAVKAMEPMIADVVDELMAPILDTDHVDLITQFAYPLPLTVIATLLGIPTSDRSHFRQWSLDIAAVADPVTSPEQIERADATMAEFVPYLRTIIRRRRHTPSTDLIGALVHAGLDGQASEDELIAMVITLINAGHETTTHLVGNGMLAFAHHPEQWALLRRKPELVDSAVEECLRFDSPVQQNIREVQCDEMNIEGVVMRRGEIVAAVLGSANRDPAEFTNPDVFDIERRPNRHVTFGHGPRFCVGAGLARAEGRIALNALVRHFRSVRLAVDPERLRYEPSTLFHGLTSLPVTCER